MGFEQLASLRDELAQKAKAEKAEKTAKRTEKKQVPSAKIDPNLRVISQLQKNFPLAFPKNPKPKVPLKIGIHKDLVEHLSGMGISEKELKIAIKTWCWGNRYWSCMLEDALRVDLAGEAAGQVSKQDADRAKRLKAGRQHKAKREATAATPVVEEITEITV